MPVDAPPARRTAPPPPGPAARRQRWLRRTAAVLALAFVAAALWTLVPPPGRHLGEGCLDPDWARVAEGRVVYIQRHDPDGDGDLHAVVAGRGSVTAPGVSVVKIDRGLRSIFPVSVGDWVRLRGWVEHGTHGERVLHEMECERVAVATRGSPGRSPG